jgi:hypothetical protein
MQLKAHLRKAAAHPSRAGCVGSGRLVTDFSAQECKNFFRYADSVIDVALRFRKQDPTVRCTAPGRLRPEAETWLHARTTDRAHNSGYTLLSST